jgi:hypothetical protein|tara:strand:+ start:169 stop:387 length:219 start_codon:yes stop_codon:yes gene_type:complete
MDALDKLEKQAKEDPEFTPEDIKIVHEMIMAYRGWQATGRAFKFIVWTFASIAALLTASGIIAGGIKSWLIS